MVGTGSKALQDRSNGLTAFLDPMLGFVNTQPSKETDRLAKVRKSREERFAGILAKCCTEGSSGRRLGRKTADQDATGERLDLSLVRRLTLFTFASHTRLSACFLIGRRSGLSIKSLNLRVRKSIVVYVQRLGR